MEISVQKAIWSTQAHNETKLNEAYENSDVILIFSVNNSRHFQGYARMISKIGSATTDIWTDGESAHWGGVFRVEWMTLYNLPFSETLHVRNPWNNNKPVKISRDGQELAPEVGVSLCKMLDEGAATEPKKRKTTEPSETQDTKKPKIETSYKTKERSLSPSKSHKQSSPSIREGSPHRSSHSPHGSRHPSGHHRSLYSSSHLDGGSYHSRHTRYNSPRRGGASLDLLNMTYEDYLNLSRSSWFQLNSAAFTGLTETDYLNYMSWMGKQQEHFYGRRKT